MPVLTLSSLVRVLNLGNANKSFPLKTARVSDSSEAPESVVPFVAFVLFEQYLRLQYAAAVRF